MIKGKKRRKTVFDQECTHVYATLIGYSTLDEARANIIQIARALRISEKAAGGYLTQASTNPRVFEHLRKLGYTESQIPQWFKRPVYPVAVQPQPQAVQVETNPPRQTPRASMPAPQVGQVGGGWAQAYITSKHQVLEGDEPYWEVKWSDGRRTRQPLTDNELADYHSQVRAQALEEYRRWETSQQREKDALRPKEPTLEEKQRKLEEEEKLNLEEAERVKRAANWSMAGLASIMLSDNMKRQKAMQRNAENREGIQELKKAMGSIPKQPTSSPIDQAAALVKGVTSLIETVQPPFDKLKEVQQEIAASKKEEWDTTLAIAKAIIDETNELDNKRSAEIRALFPPVDIDKWLAENPIQRAGPPRKYVNFKNLINYLDEEVKKWAKRNS